MATFTPSRQAPGNLIKADDWNALADELVRLGNAYEEVQKQLAEVQKQVQEDKQPASKDGKTGKDAKDAKDEKDDQPQVEAGPKHLKVGDLRIQWGELHIGEFRGTSGKNVSFPQAFAEMPHVVATVNHHYYRGSGTHDPVICWLEKISPAKCRICVREVDANNHHAAVKVHWVAIGKGG